MGQSRLYRYHPQVKFSQSRPSLDRKAGLTLIAGICGGCGIAMMILLADISALPLGAIPFATSIVLVSGAPRSAPARTKAIIFGHLICAGAGVALHYSGYESAVTVAATVGVCIAFMLAFDVFHPPAGITPLVIYGSSLDWTFLFVPVLLGAMIVALLARLSDLLQSLAEGKFLARGGADAVSAPSDRPISQSASGRTG